MLLVFFQIIFLFVRLPIWKPEWIIGFYPLTLS